MYDYDTAVNQYFYGQSDPPEVFVENIKVPVAMMVGTMDSIATLDDNYGIRDRLLDEQLFFFGTYEADHVALLLLKDATDLNNDLMYLLSLDYSEAHQYFESN